MVAILQSQGQGFYRAALKRGGDLPPLIVEWSPTQSGQYHLVAEDQWKELIPLFILSVVLVTAAILWLPMLKR